jgi:hypothetical protein
MRESTSEMSLIVAELEPRMPRNKKGSVLELIDIKGVGD